MKEPHGYRVRRDLRDTLLFAGHDLLKDSPFSRLDLISCRNLLIYLNRAAQTRAFEVFHFALRPEGRLFLGTSESADDSTHLFHALDKKHRLYAARPTSVRNFPLPSGPSSPARALAAPELEQDATGSAQHPPRFVGMHPSVPQRADQSASWMNIQLKLLERAGPPSPAREW